MRWYVRLMSKADVAQVVEIDREAFPSMWPQPNYHRELNNSLAHYIVACDEEKTVGEQEVDYASEKRRSGLAYRMRRWFKYDRFLNSEMPPPTREYILAFAGFWIMADEAHITNIAVRKVHYRRGTGEMLLIALIEMAIKLNALIITLEVRTSNITAQNLYSKYGFVKVGLRRGYYMDNGEDGVLMSTEDINTDPFRARFEQLKEAHSKKWGVAIQQAV